MAKMHLRAVGARGQAGYVVCGCYARACDRTDQLSKVSCKACLRTKVVTKMTSYPAKKRRCGRER